MCLRVTYIDLKKAHGARRGVAGLSRWSLRRAATGGNPYTMTGKELPGFR